VRRAPLKDLGILAAEAGWFKQQCDCFVTKRRVRTSCELKEFTNRLRTRSIWLPQRGTSCTDCTNKGLWLGPNSSLHAVLCPWWLLNLFVA